jgi:starch synthase
MSAGSVAASPLGTPVLRVLHVASEMVPLVKTGGLADVVGALPAALALHGIDARVLIPCYPAVARRGWPVVARMSGLPGPFGPLDGTLRLGRVEGPAGGGAEVVALDVPVLFDRGGGPYQATDGTGWPDSPFRFAALARAAQRIAQDGVLPGWMPDVVHGHDWQAGLVPPYLALSGGRRTPTVTTIHNIAFQGVTDAAHLSALQLPPSAFSIYGVEYRGGIGFLKAGLFYADRITTVSPTYAREITTPENGFGLEGLLAGRRDDLVGILNGIDDTVWNPARDPHLPAPFDAADTGPKAASTQALRAAFGLDADATAPLFAIVSRLTDQKGIDLVLGALPRLLAEGGQLCVLGTGERALEAALGAAAAANPGRVAVRIGYDDPLSHLIQAGADALLVPSRFEPCGLTQMYALRYGTVPVVRRAGGLADTVIDATPAALADGQATGVVFGDATADALADAIGRACALWRDPVARRRVQSAGMAVDNGWHRAAGAYAALYRGLPPTG